MENKWDISSTVKDLKQYIDSRHDVHDSAIFLAGMLYQETIQKEKKKRVRDEKFCLTQGL